MTTISKRYTSGEIIPGTYNIRSVILRPVDERLSELISVFVYFPKGMLEDLPRSRQITVRPIGIKNFESLRENGNIKRESRLSELMLLPKGEKVLFVHGPSAEKIKKVFGFSAFSLELQGWEEGSECREGREVASKTFVIKSLMIATEEVYNQYLDVYNTFLGAVVEGTEKARARKAAEEAKQAEPDKALQGPGNSLS